MGQLIPPCPQYTYSQTKHQLQEMAIGGGITLALGGIFHQPEWTRAGAAFGIAGIVGLAVLHHLDNQ